MWSVTTEADRKRVRRMARPNILLKWSVCGISAVLSAVTDNALFKLLMLGSWFVAAWLVYLSTSCWEQIRDDPEYADVADRNIFIRFSLTGGLLAHILGCIVVIALWYLSTVLIEHLLVPVLDEHLIDGIPAMSVFLLAFLMAEYYLIVLVHAIARDLVKKNRYPDGNQYVYRKTYEAIVERDRRNLEFVQKCAAETVRLAEDAAKREAEKRKQEEALANECRVKREAERQAMITAYQSNPEPGRRRVWEWLNIGWNLDFPDEACDLIADYTYGRVDNFGWRIILKALSAAYPEEEAERYAKKYDRVCFAVRKLKEEEESREAIDVQRNPLGLNGEKEVNYRLKWWISAHPEYRMIASDCYSQYSASCIRIAAWDMLPEPQEIDHLLVGPAGVIHIETKDYIGQINVKTTTFWQRDIRGDGTIIPFTSPAFQVQRHESVLRYILGSDVPIYGIICLSNKSVSLTDAERSDIPVVCLRDLDATLSQIDASPGNRLDADKIKAAFLKIENAKVRNSKRRAEMEKAKVQ